MPRQMAATACVPLQMAIVFVFDVNSITTALSFGVVVEDSCM
jgi:hypothetical protein